MYTFDGVGKIISFDESTTAFDVRDLWSRWEEWLLTGDNSKYQLAMRVVGGDPLVGGKELGLTYFMMNGWKIKPYEESHVLNINGNLYSEDGSSPFTPVLGAYNVTIINTVSNLVDSTVQQLPEIEYASFQNKVCIDVVNGQAGTAYPLGTPSSPVNNLANALTIASTRGFSILHLHSDLTIQSGEDISNYSIESDNWLVLTIDSGAITTNTEFTKLSLYGELGGYWNVMNDCWLYDITNFSGWVRGGSIERVELSPYVAFGGDYGGLNYFDDIVPMYPNVTSIIVGNTDVQVSMTNCKDIVTLESATAGSIFNIGLREGKLIIDSTCTGGSITVSGLGGIENNSLLTVDSETLINPEYITNAVWDELLSGHTEVGSAGKALGTASTGGVDYDTLSAVVWSSASRTLTGTTSASSISIAVWEKELEANYTAEEILKLMASVLAGITTGADGTTMKFRDLNGTKDRVTAILDGLGNRTTVTKDVS